MATVLLGEGRQGDGRLRSNNGSPTYEETWHYIVESDTVDENRATVLLTAGIPRLNVTQSETGVGVCRGIRATRRPEQPRIWDIVADFSSEVRENQNTNGDPSSNPELWVPIRETKYERLQEIVTKDVNGDSIANSAGQPFQTGMTRNRYIPVWEFFQIESASIDDETLIERHETVNETEFLGRPAKTLLLCVLSSAIGYYYGQSRRLTNYALKYNKDEWTHKRLDVGTIYIDGSAQKPYLDDSGNVILGSLNGSGDKAAVGAAPATLTFDMYPEIEFSDFLRV